MWFFLLILAALIVLLLILIPFLPVKVSVDYFRVNQDDNMKIKVEALFGLIRYRLEFSSIKIRNWLLGPVLEVQAEFFGAKGKAGDEEIKEEFGLQALDLKTLIDKFKFLLKITDQFDAMVEMMKSFRREGRHDEEIRMENVVIFRVMGMLFMGLKGQCDKLIWHTRYGFSDAALTAITNGLIWAGKSTALSALSLICTFKTEPQITVEPDFESVGLDMQFESIFSVRIGNIMSTGLKILLQEYKRRARHRWPIIQLRH